MSRQDAEKSGRKGEWRAAWFLRLKGWRILGKRIQTPVGEIDLIIRRGRTVAFVEVKWRKSVMERDRALYNDLLRRVAAAAEAVAHNYVRSGDRQRIDAVLLAPRTMPLHLENVWQP
jgi:Holliday junction resolvase-like predicted endonuclease